VEIYVNEFMKPINMYCAVHCIFVGQMDLAVFVIILIIFTMGNGTVFVDNFCGSYQ